MNIEYIGRGYQLEDPNICPHCHVTNTPHYKWHSITKDTDNVISNISIWQCSNSKCNKIFVVLHRFSINTFHFTRFLNGLPKGPDWPNPIVDLKSGQIDEIGNSVQSRFIKTYLQSLEAESYGLDELAGMGYRKAIEYLVKDWAIQNHSDKKRKLKNCG